MPRIDVNSLPSVQNAPLRGNFDITASPDAFGASIGQALGNVVEQYGKVVQEQRSDTLKQAAIEYDKQAQDYKTNDLFTKLGKDGFEESKQAPDKLNAILDGVKKQYGITGDKDLNSRFDLAVGIDHNNNISSAQKYGFSQFVEQQRDTSKKFIENSINRAIASPSPTVIAMSLDDINNQIKEDTKREGWNPDQAANARYTATSTLHSAIVERLIANNQTGDARAYLTANRDDIQGLDQVRLEKMLNPASEFAQAQAIAQQAYLAPVSKADQINMILKNAGGNEQAARDAMYLFNIKSEADDQAHKEASDALFKDLAVKADRDNIPYEQIVKDNPDIWKLDQNQRDAIKHIGEVKNKPPSDSDPKDWQALHDMVANDPNKFSGEDLFKYNLSKTDREQYQKTQDEIKGGDFVKSVTSGWINSQVDTILTGVIDKKTKNAKDNPEYADFQKALQTKVTQWQLTNPTKSVTPDLITQLSDQMLLKGEINFKGGKREGFAFEAKPGESLTVPVTTGNNDWIPFNSTRVDIPAPDYQGIIEAYKRHNNGAEPSEEDIMGAYSKLLAKRQGQ